MVILGVDSRYSYLAWLGQADFSTVNVTVDQKFHGRVIGAGGTSLKKLLSTYEGAVSIKFPQASGSASDASTVVIKGPSDKANDCARRLKEMVDEWKHQEIMCSFSEDVKVPKEAAKRILGTQGQRAGAEEGAPSGGWIIRAIKEKVAGMDAKAAGGLTDRDVNMTRFEIASSGEKGGFGGGFVKFEAFTDRLARFQET